MGLVVQHATQLYRSDRKRRESVRMHWDQFLRRAWFLEEDLLLFFILIRQVYLQASAQLQEQIWIRNASTALCKDCIMQPFSQGGSGGIMFSSPLQLQYPFNLLPAGYVCHRNQSRYWDGMHAGEYMSGLVKAGSVGDGNQNIAEKNTREDKHVERLTHSTPAHLSQLRKASICNVNAFYMILMILLALSDV